MYSLKIIQISIFSFFLFLYAVVYTVTTNDKDEQIKLSLEQQIENNNNNYKVSINRFKILSDLFYHNILIKKEVLELLYKAKHSSTEKERTAIRKKLYNKIKPFFSQLSKSGLKIMLFAFENNRTFLRVHKPKKFNDDLSSVRYSFTYVNDTRKPVRGFEQGKISHAFRNIFPLFYANEYIGSVDLAFSSEVLQENMTKIHGIDTHFIVDKSIFDVKVWNLQNKVKYIKSIEHEDFLFSLTPSQNSKAFSSDKLELNKSLKEEIYQNIKHQGPFSLYEHIGDKVEIISFFPIKNIKDKKTVAYLVSYSYNNYLEGVLDKYYWINGLFFIGLILLAFVISNNVKQHYYLKAQVREEVEKNRLQDKLLLENSKKAQDKLNKAITLFGENVMSSNSDPKGIITYASQALCDVSGYTQEELIGKPHSILRHPDMKKEIFKDMWETIQSGNIWQGEIKNLKKNGEYYWVRSSIMPELDAQSNVVGYTSIRHEITSQKVKEEFMANISHELRTPLNAIIGFSGILKKTLKNSSDNGLITQINSSANSLLILINDILDISKIQDSKFAIEVHEFNAYNEIVEYSKNFDGLISGKDLVFKNKTSKNLQAVFMGDWLRISQIILNLVSNAIKFTSKGGEIICETDYIDKNLVISIIDNGIGMDKKTQDKIFKPFEQADGSTTRKYGGTGLGLSITQSLVELMDGKIELESEEGKGSTFRITIPLEMIQNDNIVIDENEQEKESKENTLDGHILIVEDNKTNQMLVRMFIEGFGLTCDMANDGVEAVEVYKPDVHKLVLMDENMPNMNGIEAMKTIKEKYKDRCGAIISLTANAMEGDKEKFLNLGMDGYISKPIDEDKLYNTLVEFL